MTYSEQARTATRRIRIRRIRVTGLLVVIAAIVAALGYQLLASSVLDGHHPSTSFAVSTVVFAVNTVVFAVSTVVRLARLTVPVPDGATVFDDEIPGVANLDPICSVPCSKPQLMPRTTVEFFVDSGWRSPEYQNQLLREAVSGTDPKRKPPGGWPPRRHLLTCREAQSTSGPSVPAWLSEHGAEYGLCQIYGNEPWHYELRPEAIDHRCPPMHADPTHDPGMQQ